MLWGARAVKEVERLAIAIGARLSIVAHARREDGVEVLCDTRVVEDRAKESARAP
jgi:hypothetical protein